MKTKIVLALFAAAGLISSAAQAVDLAGEWSVIQGKSQGALSGKPDHKAVEGGDLIFSGAASDPNLPFVLKINDQKGNGFHAQWCSPKKCEKAVGVIRKDGSILMADEDSTFLAAMYGNEMELCVTEPGKSLRIAICYMMEKK